jgi:atrial natriuretic peptide receptor A
MHPNRMTIRVGLILPVNDDRPFSIQKSIPAIQIALSSNEVMKRLLPGCRFDLYTKNSKCNSIAAPIAAFELMETIKVHVIFGPVCDYSLAPVARYSPYWDTPVISPGGMATDFGANKTEEKAEFKLLTRIGITFEDFAIFMYSIVSHFNWKNIKVLYSADGHSEVASRFCNLAISAISRLFNKKNIETRLTSFEQREEDEDIENILLNQIGLDFSVVILCNSPDSIRNFMIQAAELNFINGDYVFINIDLFSRSDHRLFFIQNIFT